MENFISAIIQKDITNNPSMEVITRFPPEPNGYLHIGHAKSIYYNFTLAKIFNGKCNLRFDDTNPSKETVEYIESIKDDIKWLGFHWAGDVKYASDYFQQMYDFAVWFISKGLAYIDDLTPDEIHNLRGTLTESGVNSPYRNRSIEENLDMFDKMKNKMFHDGEKVLRLKIDMASPNLNLRDPVIYRIKHTHHIRTENKWCIYPLYDYAHCISDALEYITHSCCTLEFADHRPLYDWIIEHLYTGKHIFHKPKQIEFARLELVGSVTSKRKLQELVSTNVVNGWNDPRLLTIAGMRKRGYNKEGINLFAQRVGLSKSPNIVSMNTLHETIRENLETSPKCMAVINPIKVILTNFNDNVLSKSVLFRDDIGTRLCKLTSEIYIENTDFQEFPVSGFKRLTVGSEVRLRHSYVIKCESIVDTKNTRELHCSIDYDTFGKNPTNRKINSVIHWVSATENVIAEIKLYEELFTEESSYTSINPNSLIKTTAYLESEFNLCNEKYWQFERIGYFILDIDASSDELMVFNKIVGLKEKWK